MRLSQFCKNELQAQYSFTYRAYTWLRNKCIKKINFLFVNTVHSQFTMTV